MRGREIEKLYAMEGITRAVVRERNDHYVLLWSRGPCALGISSQHGGPAIIFSVEQASSNIGRTTVGLELRQVTKASFVFNDREWQSSAVIVECRSELFVPTFAAFAAEMIGSVEHEENLTARGILSLFEQWEQLFCCASRLDAQEELGLWGELFLISGSREIDSAVAAWVGHRISRVDFLGNGVGLEAKSSVDRLRHHISLSQAEEPVGELRAYFVSVWCEQDDGRGISLPALIDKIAARVVDSSAFEKKLIRWGYSRQDATAYTAKYMPLHRPWLFSSELVPRVRQIDRGVSSVRYTVSLDESRAVSSDESRTILANVLGFDLDSMLNRQQIDRG